jgi:type II secretory pathway pseudopilin PulG
MRAIPSRSEAGFTLIELMMGAMISVIVIVLAGGLYLSSVRSVQADSRKVTAQQEASLMSQAIARQVRAGHDIRVYRVPNRATEVDSGDGVAVIDTTGADRAYLEWSRADSALVDGPAGHRVSAAHIDSLAFVVDPAFPRTVKYRYQVDDNAGYQIRFESAATARN